VRAGAPVDELDARQIPARDAEPELEQRAIDRGHLEAHALDRDGAVAPSLRARDLHAEGAPEGFGAGTVAADVRALEVTLERGHLDLGVDRAVILLLDPRLRRGVEQVEREVRDTFEHGHEAALDQGPEVLLFGILFGAVREREILKDTQPLMAFDGLRGFHGGAPVAERRPRQLALLESLTETVDEILRILSIQIPLRVTTHPRAVVEYTEEIRRLPLPGRGEHLPLAHMEVVVPERIDVRDLVGARLARDLLGLAAFAAAPADAHHAAVLHEAAHRRVARHRIERRILLRDRDEVVVMELIAPAPVLVVLLRDRLGEGFRHARMRACVLGHLALEGEQGVRLVADGVVHLLDRLGPVVQYPPRRRVLPRRGGELVDAADELAPLRR